MNRIRTTWNESLRAVSDPRIRIGAGVTMIVLGCAVFTTAMASAMPSPLSWFLAGMLNAFVLSCAITLAGTVASVRKARDGEEMARRASTMIAGFVAEELKGRGLDVEVTAGPEGIAVRRRSPATTVH
jgi:uncharacterized membrane protein